ncbi:hypothetical protein CLOM_g23930 [Closterium sp. NIES-68]|nr:hypothetical protein CLOM_g23930 [Closterium sp. NIES-68]GJP86253.1 hypothetical protein CLOP_g16298 [Closterium sp. NIES-67]
MSEAAAAARAAGERNAAAAPTPAGETPPASASLGPAEQAATEALLDSERRDPVEADSLEAAAKASDSGIRHPIFPCGGLKSAAHSIPEADIPALSGMGTTFGAFAVGAIPQDGAFPPTLPHVRVDYPPGHLVRTTSQDSSVAATLGSPTGSIRSLDQFSTCSSIPPYHMSPAPSFTSDQPMADVAGSGLVTSRLGITSKALFSSPGEKPVVGPSVGGPEQEAGGVRGAPGTTYPSPPNVQTLVVVRHAEPIDEQDDGWAAGSDRPWDPPLSARGAKAAEEVGQALRARGFGAARSSAGGSGGGRATDEVQAVAGGGEASVQREGEGERVVRVVVSPFKRCVQTAVHLVAGLLGAQTTEGKEGGAGEEVGAGGAAEGSEAAKAQAQSAPSGVTVTVSISPALAEVMNTRALRRCTEERPPAASTPHSSVAEHAGLAAAVEAAAAEAGAKGWVLGEGDLRALFPAGTVFLPLHAAASGDGRAGLAVGEARPGRSVHSEFPLFPESLESARERFMQAFDDVAALFPADNILCVTHGDAVAASVERLAPVTVVAVDFCGYSWSQRRSAPLYTTLNLHQHHSHHHAGLPPLPPPPPPPPTPANEPESLDAEEASLLGSRQTVSASFAAAVVAAGSETEAAAVAAAAVAAVAGLEARRRGELDGVAEEGREGEEGELGEEGEEGSEDRSGGKQGALSDGVVIVGGSTASDISTHESEEDDKDTRSIDVNSSIDVGPSLSEVAEGDEEGEDREGEEGEEVESERGQEGMGGRGRGEARRGGGMEVGEWELLTSSGSTGVCWISNIALAARDDETPTKGLAS